MPFQSYFDGEILTAGALNSDNATSLDINTATAQTVVGTVTFGGLLTTPLTVLGLAAFKGAVSENITVVSSGASYQVSATDRYVVISKASTTAVSLPASPVVGRKVTVKDGGNATTFAITISPNPGTLRIDANATYLITSNYGVATFIWSGTLWLSV